MRAIRGAGGGGGKGGGSGSRTPVESPDSLRSRQYARVLDLVSEGEIGGLVDGLKSVYLDDAPIMNADGSLNFTGVTLASRNGTQSQSYIPGFGAVEAETAVSVEVIQAAPVVRSISNPNANAVRVTVSTPKLSLQNTSNGDTGGTSVEIAVDLQTAGGGYVQQVLDTISGKTSSRYQRSYRIELTGSGPWDIRVRRITADSTTATLANSTYWDSYTEIIDAKLSYPNSALEALSIDAERFASIPKRGYEMMGLHVRIPNNYNPTTREYTGVWNGSFTTAWTNNPAWCFYDLLTSVRYGLGAFIAADQVDKWALYQIAQHCDELVPDGFGGMEPRFTCNLYLQTREEAYRVITNFAAIFCSMAFWGAGSIMTVQDAPADPVKLFTNANVVPSDGAYFNYSGSSIKSRHTVALVSWNDPEDRYKQKIEYVEDLEGIAKYGIIQTEVVAMGCTSRGQAHRYGRRILYTERMETETITFRTGMDGLSIAPGDIIQTSDPARAGVRMGGRLIAATASTVTLDAAVMLSPSATYTLWAVLPNGEVESRSVTTGASTTAALTVSPAFSGVPQAMAMWVLAASNLAPETWRVISIAEANGTQAEISALKYSANKYAEIEQGIILEALPISSLSTQQAAPTDLVISEELYVVAPAVIGTRITLSWSCNAQYYELQYRVDGGNWSKVSTSTPSTDIQPVDHGLYEFKLIAINAIGNRSQPVAASQTIYGKTSPPEDVTSINYEIEQFGVRVGWAPVSDIDIDFYEVRLGGEDWASAAFLTQVWGAEYFLAPQATGTVAVRVKAVDTSGNYSANAASAAIVIAPIQAPIVTAEISGADEILSFTPPSSAFQIASYEIRYGLSWGAGTLIATSTANSFRKKIDYIGPRTYWVAAIDVAGNVGAAVSITQTITAPGAPTTPSVSYAADAGATLAWKPPATGTLAIAAYEIRYGLIWSTATPVTTLNALTCRVPMSWFGGRQFLIAAIDVAGNVGAAISLSATVIAHAAVAGITNAIAGRMSVLSWTPPVIAGGVLPVRSYEVRRGASWESGSPVAITADTKIQLEVDWTQTATFFVAITDINGNFGATTGSTVSTITAPSAPIPQASLAGTDVVLAWPAPLPGGLSIAKYEVRYGASFAAGTYVTAVSGASATVPVTWSGARIFHVAAIDTSGNVSAAGSVTVTINTPNAPVINVTDSLVGAALLDQYRLAWVVSVVDGTRLPIDHYVVGYGAVTLAKVKGTTYIAKANWAGIRNFWVQAVDVNGAASSQAPVSLTVTAPSAPTTLTMQVIDNNVLMYWSGATATLPITDYELAKEATFNANAPATYIGKKSGGFTTVFETAAGNYTYFVRAIDSAGNNGAAKSGVAAVAQPPDYILNAVWQSDFSGTKFNAVLDADGSLLIPVHTAETWTTHFTNNGYTSPQSQVTAGFPNYAQPTPASGYYEQVFDYGTLLAATKVTVTSSADLVNSPAVTCDISTSSDGVAYTAYAGVWSVYATSFRYVKVRITVTATGSNDQYDVKDLTVTLDSKIKNDAGMKACLSTDVGGTLVNFNVPFVDITSITVTPSGTANVTAIYDFVDTPNPTSFKILLLNPTTGARVSGTASWSVKGY